MTKTPRDAIADAFNGATFARERANDIIAALSAAGFAFYNARTHVAVDKAALWDLFVATKKVTHGHGAAAEEPDHAD